MIWTVCWIIFIENVSGAQLLNCPASNVTFEKTLGLRPTNASNSFLLYKLEDNVPLRPVTTECIAKCQSNDRCRSFVLYYSTARCYWYGNNFADVDESQFVIDEDASWFSKTCFKNRNCNKLWEFEIIPGATLIGNNTKSLMGTFTRTDCINYCFNETEFLCRSAKFNLVTNTYGVSRNKGTCVLSDADRHLLPNAFRVSGYDDEYLENQCTTESNFSQDEFCAYEEYENVTLAHSDVLIEGKSKQDCQNICDKFRYFNCRGFSFKRSNMCYLHSEDSKIFGPTLLKPSFDTTFYEKARCLNVSVRCSETYITMTYKPETDFFGKIYMQGFSENPQCFATGDGRSKIVILKIPLLTGSCGFITASGYGMINRTLLTGVMIIQYNPIIQTQNDRIIRVGCIFGNDTKVLVGTGVTISSLIPNKGSSLVNNSTTSGVFPIIEMRILDLSTHNEVSDVQIGQELQLIIEMTRRSSNDSFDIWASHLVAMTEKGDESIFLLDDRGCPTNLNIFPALEKVTTMHFIQLIATFHAFKFATSPVVRFSVIVQFCSSKCALISCSDSIKSYGKKKRNISPLTINTLNGTRVIESSRFEFENPSSLVNEMPLEYFIVVRDSNFVSDRLMSGKILVAGYDYIKDEVCMDYSLVIGLIVFWILIQIFFVAGCIILVRRYKRYYQHECMRQSLEELHKNFGIGFSNLENRRVHWANEDNIM